MNETSTDGKATAPESPATMSPPPEAARAATATATTRPANLDRAVTAGLAPSGKVQRAYTVEPKATAMLPKRVEKLLVKHLRLKDKAGALWGEADEALLAALAETRETRGSGRQKVIVPGVVYQLSRGIHVGNGPKGGIKHTLQVEDVFAHPSGVSKMCKMSRWALHLWKGDGPKAGRAERRASNTEEDVLP